MLALYEMILLDNKTITLQDAREVGGCVPGWRYFCETNGFVWKDVVKYGLTAQELYHTNDSMAHDILRKVYYG